MVTYVDLNLNLSSGNKKITSSVSVTSSVRHRKSANAWKKKAASYLQKADKCISMTKQQEYRQKAEQAEQKAKRSIELAEKAAKNESKNNLQKS